MSDLRTYISLFSSAGVGCFGFKMEGFHCIATNELIQRRLDVQKNNCKCKYPTGYICGDITEQGTVDSIFREIEFWKKTEKIKNVDVVIATPPCQGMSVANHKKTSTEIVRNSLVVESIKIINDIRPNFFVFENVPAFMKTVCTDIDGIDKPISEAIKMNLGKQYSYTSRIINFKNHGASSSRSRCLVIGVINNLADEISPIELYPDWRPEETLREVIGHLPRLCEMGEIQPDDFYHVFRSYPAHMRSWISSLNEGESAFDNEEETYKPHQIINGEIVINQQKNGDKYKRQHWDRVGPCIHTRNDQLASQNTIHPSDDRVFSIRELMIMMSIPDSFRWVDKPLDELNHLSAFEKQKILKKEEVNIRQSLGEAVPTEIFRSIAKKITEHLSFSKYSTKDIQNIVDANNFSDCDCLIDFIVTNPLNLSASVLGRIAELSNTSRTDNAAFFTNKSLITEMLKNIPDNDFQDITILEPSVGVGNFVPLIIKRFEQKNIILDLLDVDENSIRIMQALLSKVDVPANVTINFINDDFLLHEFKTRYDYIIGNPPFYKMGKNDKSFSLYRSNAINKGTTNICSYFLDRCITLADYVALILPKYVLNNPEFIKSRQYLSKKCVDAVIDFGEKGFRGVLVETIALHIDNKRKPNITKVISYTHKIELSQKQSYICCPSFPYWIIYRNEEFDAVCRKMDFGVFSAFRDRQISKKHEKQQGEVRILKARNISDSGEEILDIPGYDAYIDLESAAQFAVYKYFNSENVYMTPNMTYYPRVMVKPKGTIANGSLAILTPIGDITPTANQLKYFSSKEYRIFYQIARNMQTRSLNIDSCSVYFFGLLRGETKSISKELDETQVCFLHEE